MIFGSDSPMPTLRDLKDFLKMLRWFFGLGPRPGFDRWSYWEKIDFWGAIADTVIIGSTGLVLWFPNFFCGPLPGTTLNIAQVIHSTQALLATGFVFAIHFFNTHFRPDRFPADMSVLTGLVSEEEFKEDRPEYFERLEREGKLEAMRTTSPGLFVLWCIRTLWIPGVGRRAGAAVGHDRRLAGMKVRQCERSDRVRPIGPIGSTCDTEENLSMEPSNTPSTSAAPPPRVARLAEGAAHSLSHCWPCWRHGCF